MLSRDDIQHIANLSRIRITEKEAEKFSNNLSSILDFVSQLKEAEGEVSDEKLREAELYNVLREDTGDNRELEGIGKDLVDMVPEKKDNYIKVKRIL